MASPSLVTLQLPLLFLQTWFPLSSYPVTKEGAKNSNPKELHGPSPRGPTPRSPKPCHCSQQGPRPLPSRLPPFCLFPWLCPSDCCSWSSQRPPHRPPPLPPSSPLQSLWEFLGMEGEACSPLTLAGAHHDLQGTPTPHLDPSHSHRGATPVHYYRKGITSERRRPCPEATRLIKVGVNVPPSLPT